MVKNKILVYIAFIVLLPTLFILPVIADDIHIDLPTEPENHTSDQRMGVFLFDNRQLLSDLPEQGGVSLNYYRMNDYAFEGEVIYFPVLALHLDGIENVQDVYVAVSTSQSSPPNEKKVSCVLGEQPAEGSSIQRANARFGEEGFEEFDSDIMAMYACYYVVENKYLVYGEYWIGVKISDINNTYEQMDENEYWFFNPALGLSLNPATLDLGEKDAGEIVYSDIFFVRNDAEADAGVILNMSISSTDFYHTSPSISKCPITNMLTADHIKYFAANGAYSTLNDPRADEEGYIPLSHEDSAIINNLWGNILHPGGELAIQFKVNIPERCRGNFDTGNIIIKGTEPANNNQSATVYLPLNLNINTKMNITLINNITLIDDCVEGICGEEIKGNRTFLFEWDGILYPLTYLFEVEQIRLIVQINISSGIENIEGVYGTIGIEPIAGNDIVVECHFINGSSTTANYDCILTIETPENMYGNSLIKAEVDTTYGGHNEIEIGYWSLNPLIDISLDKDSINFSDSSPGQRIYSEPLTIKNNVDLQNYVLLSMYLSRKNKLINSNLNQLDLSSLSYYAEIGNYSTLNDPRADDEGYINLKYASSFDPGSFSNFYELIQKGDFLWDKCYSENLLEEGEEAKIIFRLDVPENTALGDYHGNAGYAWAVAGEGWGPSVGKYINLNLRVGEVFCYIDSDCGTDNFVGDNFCYNENVYGDLQSFTCTNPGTIDSYCESSIEPVLVEECKLGCSNGACIQDINPPEAIIKYDNKLKDFVISGKDDYDLDVDVNYTEKSYFRELRKIRDYVLTDDFGNELKIKISYTILGNYILTNIAKLSYNGESINPNYNWLTIIDKKNGNINQHFYLSGFGRINAVYNSKKDKTTIEIINGRKTTKIIKDGFFPIGLMTEKGKLSYNL